MACLRIALLVAPWLTGCVGVADMSASQIRATNGMIMCSQVVSIYGKGSSITVNADDIRKGATAKGKTSITCGDSQMVIEQEVGTARDQAGESAKSLVNLLEGLP